MTLFFIQAVSANIPRKCIIRESPILIRIWRIMNTHLNSEWCGFCPVNVICRLSSLGSGCTDFCPSSPVSSWFVLLR